MKVLSYAAALAVCLCLEGMTAGAYRSHSGDIDGNNTSDTADASAVMQEYNLISTGLSGTFSPAMMYAGDVNGDGLTDAADASFILRYYSWDSTGGDLDLPHYAGRLSSEKVLTADVRKDSYLSLSDGMCIALDISGQEFLEYFDFNDTVTVSVNGHVLDVPVCSRRSDIDLYTDCIYMDKGNTTLFGTDEDTVYITSRYDPVAVSAGLVVKDPGGSKQKYVFSPELEGPVKAEIWLKEKGGYSRREAVSRLIRTHDRNSYPDLTDEEYANFRMISMGDIAPGVLYRTSSPIDSSLGRNAWADRAAEIHGIKTVVNLADTQSHGEKYSGFSESYYSRQNVAYVGLPLVFGSENFRKGIAAGLRHIAQNEGPYLIHCMEGKYRSGFFSAVLECLMGAGIEQVENDYLKSYQNYYAVADGIHQPLPEGMEQEIIEVIEMFLSREFGVLDLHTADISAAAENYIRGLGLSDEEIGKLRKNLSGK